MKSNNLNFKLPINEIYVSFGDYTTNKKVRFYVHEYLGDKQQDVYYEITKDGLKNIDNMPHDQQPNFSEICKLVVVKHHNANKKSILCGNIRYSTYVDEYFGEARSSDIFYAPLIDGLFDNLNDKHEQHQKTSVLHYLTHMGLNAYSRNKELEPEVLLEFKKILDNICQKSHNNYKFKQEQHEL